MAIRTIDDTSLINIASVIRARLHTEDTYRPDQMAAAINSISGVTEYWESIGYTDTPPDIADSYEKALDIIENWDNSISDRSNMLNGDDEITIWPGVDMSAVTTLYKAFNGCDRLSSISLKNTGNVTDMKEMCTNSQNLRGFDASPDFSLVTSIKYMLYGCARWCQNIDWYLPNCTDFESAFEGLGTGNFSTPLSLSIKINCPKAQTLHRMCATNDWSSRRPITSVELTTSSDLTWLREAFANCNQLEYVKITDIGSVTGDGWISAFYNCTSLTDIDCDLDFSLAGSLWGVFQGCTSLTGVLNIIMTSSNVYNASYMFEGCTELEDVPILDISNLGTQNYGTDRLYMMFNNCPSLTDESLDNILQMCINSGMNPQYNPTLSTLGFNSTNYPVSRMEALPHYADFITAGWTLGYS